MMKAHGDYIMPDNVPANEFLNLENDKISTSRNWAIWLHEYLVDFPGKQDVLRYVLTANAPETKDNNFMWKDFQERNNSELVAIYGNFVNRALQLTKKYFEGVVPECGELLDVDCQAINEFKDVKENVEQMLDQFKFRDALKEAMNLARIGNRYITECEPWKVAKTDMERVKTILNLSLQISANLAIVFEPFLPVKVVGKIVRSGHGRRILDHGLAVVYLRSLVVSLAELAVAGAHVAAVRLAEGGGGQQQQRRAAYD